MQQQPELIDHVIPEDALSADVMALGGPYKVGKKLRPELEKEAARNWLLNCLNPEHAQNLKQSQIKLIVEWARAIGSTNYAEYWPSAHNMSKPVKIEPEDEKVRIQRELLSMGKKMESMFSQLQALNNNNVTCLTGHK